MFEDGENIKEAEDVCSDKIKISLDVEGLNEELALKKEEAKKWSKKRIIS